MRGRWGGRRGSFKFFIQKFYEKVNLSTIKTVTAKEDFVSNTKTVQDLQYTDIGGIHSIDSTVQFRKKAIEVGPPIKVLIQGADVANEDLRTKLLAVDALHGNGNMEITMDMYSSNYPTITDATPYDVVISWKNYSGRGGAWASALSNGLGVIKCQFYATRLDTANDYNLPSTLSPVDTTVVTNSNVSSEVWTSNFSDTVIGIGVNTFAQYYKSTNLSTLTLQSGAVREGNLWAYKEYNGQRAVIFNSFPREAATGYKTTSTNWDTGTGNDRALLNAIYYAAGQALDGSDG
jgi:hypothetical protein